MLPVSEEVVFPREFYGRLFAAEQPSPQQQSIRRGQKGPLRGGRQNQRTIVNQSENGEAAPKSRLNALQTKHNVSIVSLLRFVQFLFFNYTA